MGVAALVSVGSFGDSLLDAVESQAKTLLGADLAVRSRGPFSAEAEALLDSFGGEQARLTSFASMAVFSEQDATRLVRVRAISGGFPFYGEIETEPPGLFDSLSGGPLAIADHTLMLQYGLAAGDTIRLGAVEFEIIGAVLRIPGESAAFSDFAPPVFIPGEYLEDTGLIQIGSRVRYRTYFKFDPSRDVEDLLEKSEADLKRLELSTDTVEERKEDFQRELANLSRFLGLVGFVALILGSIGVASSVHLYIRQRLAAVAVLRCLGASSRQGFSIYLIQAAAMGFLGALAGSLIGILVQRFLPVILADLLPITLEQRISWSAVGQGMLVGLGAAFLFALIPLVPIRKISPLLALRSDFEEQSKGRRDPLVWLIFLLITVSLLGFSLIYSTRWTVGLGFFLGIVGVFGLLFAVAKGIMILAKRYFPTSWSYERRQGLANLFRPHNQTVVLMLALGLGTFFIVTLYLTQISLLAEVAITGSENRPNLVFFDVQNDQKGPIKSKILAEGLPILQDVPIVTMRLSSVNGRGVKEILEESEGRRGRWALRREYRSTYRAELSDAESILEGTFQSRANADQVLVSVEEGVAEALGVNIGDDLVFDVQGIPVETEVGSIRQVEWRNFQPNFFIVFPLGILEDAPQFHVLVTRTPADEVSARLQVAVIREFPNVSAIDLSLVLETVDSILASVTTVIRFMALFSIITGLVVLTGAIASGRYQRMKEAVLLRTLGASRRQVWKILLLEYSFLGLLAAFTGLLLAVIASWAVTNFVFESVFVPALLPILGALAVVVSLTIVVGVLNSRGIFDRPPLEVLRAEE
jgi:putative ABC transport system permease protein